MPEQLMVQRNFWGGVVILVALSACAASNTVNYRNSNLSENDIERSTGFDDNVEITPSKTSLDNYQHPEFPQKSFFIALGRSSNMQEAKQHARKELLLKVSETIGKVIQFHHSIKLKKKRSTTEQLGNFESPQEALDRYLNLMQRDFQIGDIKKQANGKLFEVITVLEKRKLVGLFDLELQRLESQAMRYLKQAERELDPLQKITYTRIAAKKKLQADNMAESLISLFPALTQARGRAPQLQLDNAISGIISKIRIQPRIDKKDKALLQAVSGGVADAGFIVDHGKSPHYILKARFKRDSMKWKDGVYALKGSLQLELLDPASKGRSRGLATWEINITADDRPVLHKKLMDEIALLNKNHLRQAVLSFDVLESK